MFRNRSVQVKVVKDAVQVTNAGPVRHLHPDDVKVIKDVVKGLALAAAFVYVVNATLNTAEEVILLAIKK